MFVDNRKTVLKLSTSLMFEATVARENNHDISGSDTDKADICLEFSLVKEKKMFLFSDLIEKYQWNVFVLTLTTSVIIWFNLALRLKMVLFSLTIIITLSITQRIAYTNTKPIRISTIAAAIPQRTWRGKHNNISESNIVNASNR